MDGTARIGQCLPVPTPAHHLAFGRAIRELRKERGLSQEALALRAGLDRSYVGDIERGQRNPSLASILKIVEGLEVPASELFRRYEEVVERRRA